MIARLTLAALLSAAVIATLASSASATPVGRYFRVPGSPWNKPIPPNAPISPDNAAYVADLERMTLAGNQAGKFSPGRDKYSCPVYEVNALTPRVPVALYNGTVRDVPAQDGNIRHELAWRFAQGVPIPLGATPALGSDKHLVIVDTDTGEYWEMWRADFGVREPGWSTLWAGYMPDHRLNIGQFQDVADPYQHKSWGATATSLPCAAGIGLDSEIAAGLIPHTLHAVLPEPKARPAFVWPAQRADGWPRGVIPEGSRFRLKQSFDVNTLVSTRGDQATKTLRTIATALKKYGAIVTDRSVLGSPISFRFAPTPGVSDLQVFGDPNWRVLRLLNASDMEFISTAYRPT